LDHDTSGLCEPTKEQEASHRVQCFSPPAEDEHYLGSRLSTEQAVQLSFRGGEALSSIGMSYNRLLEAHVAYWENPKVVNHIQKAQRRGATTSLTGGITRAMIGNLNVTTAQCVKRELSSVLWSLARLRAAEDNTIGIIGGMCQARDIVAGRGHSGVPGTVYHATEPEEPHQEDPSESALR